MSNAKDIELFQTLCFIACMQHGQGLIDKAPSYITEKKKTCQSPLSAWHMLDCEVQCRLFKWANKFGFPLRNLLGDILQDVL